MYNGPEGKLHVVLDVDGRVFVHADIYEPQRVKEYTHILEQLEEGLKDRGVERLYTLADSLETFRYNSVMGFKTNLEVWDDVYEVMVKEL